MKALLFAPLAVVMAWAVGVSGAVIHVSPNGGNTPPYTNWAMAAQAMFDAMITAGSGDTVLVSNGTYSVEVPIMLTDAITVQSVNGAAKTQLRGGGVDQVLYVSAAGAVVQGFTISGGTAYNGGGIFLSSAGLVRDCVVVSNVAANGGGGIYQEYGGMVSNCLVAYNAAAYGGGLFTYFGGYAKNCTVSNNVAANRGGGLYAQMNGGIDTCVFAMNIASNEGGGLYLYGNGMQMTNCTVRANRARNNGAGVYHVLGGTLYNCRIENNNTLSSGGSGGGFYMDQGGSVFDSTIAGNIASNIGGGIYFDEGGFAHGCVISNNQSSSQGGGAYLYVGGRMGSCRIVNNRSGLGGGALFSSPGGWVTNCLILRNSAASGGGLYAFFGGRARNCLVAYNVASNGMSGSGGGADITYGGTLESCTVVDNFAQSWGGGLMRGDSSTVMNSVVYFNLSGGTTGSNYYDSTATDYVHCCIAPLPAVGIGNTPADPKFQNRAAGNFRLQSTSPCVNTGTNQEWMVAAVDLLGAPRIFQDVTDMGAAEYATLCRLAITGTPRLAGAPLPLGYGVHDVYGPIIVTNTVTSPAVDGPGSRSVCTGWFGQGSAPAAGTSTQAVFLLTNDTILAWQWQDQRQLTCAVQGAGTVGGAGDGWFALNSSATVTGMPAAWHAFTNWTGDIPPGATASNPVTLLMDQPRSIAAVFNANTTSNGTPQYWLASYGWTQNFEVVDNLDQDGDGLITRLEFIALTVPTNRQSCFLLEYGPAPAGRGTVTLMTATSRVYAVFVGTHLPSNTWAGLVTNLPGTGSSMTFTNPGAAAGEFLRAHVRLP